MSLRPDIQQRDPEADFSLGDITFSNPTLLLSQFHLGLNEGRSRYEGAELVNGANVYHFERSKYLNLTKDDPIVTPDQINEMVKERPGLFIPQNTYATVADALIQRYDDNLMYRFIGNHPQPGWLGKLSALGGSTAITLLDPASLAGGGAGVTLTKLGLPWAAKAMETVGVKQIMGSQASRVASTIAQNAAIGAGFGAGQQAVIEVGEENLLRQQGKPSEWVQSAQNVGHAIGLGAAIGAGVGTAGLLATRTFDHLHPKAKAVLSRYYTPITKDSDVTAREEAAGQGYNGQTPDVTPVLRQGAIDAGENLRARLKENEVNIPELDNHLVEANDSITVEMQTLSETRKSILALDKQLESRFEKAIEENQELSQAGILKTFKKAQFEKSFIENSGLTIPENFKKHIEIQEQIKNLKEKLGEEKKTRPNVTVINPKLGAQDIERVRPEPNKQVIRRIAQLEKKQVRVQTPKQELMSLKKQLLGKEGLPSNYLESTPYKRLQDLSNVWGAAKDLLERVNLEAEHNRQLNELVNQQGLIASVRSQINDAHIPLTADDMKAYGDHLSSTGIEKIDYELPSEREVSIEEHLNDFEEGQVKNLLEKNNLEEIRSEFEATKERVKNQPSFSKMMKDMVNCILKGGV